jgi:hypothetical protein
MDITALQQAMSGQSITNGWDAICALNAAQATAIFFQQYLQNGPINPSALTLRAILLQDSDFWLLDLALGAPDVSFPADLTTQQCQLEMFLVKGTLLKFYADPGGDPPFIRSAIFVRPNESWLTGNVNLADLRGSENQVLGTIYVDFASGSYAPQIAGIDPASTLNTEIGLAVQTFFANNAVTYTIGHIGLSNIPTYLQPTDFRFMTQPAPGSSTGDGCIVICIQTTGNPGTLTPLAPYPIPSGNTAAVLVSNALLFTQVMADGLSREFASLGTVFSGVQAGALWQTRGSGGQIDVGVLGDTRDPHQPYSSDSSTNPTPVKVSTDGFTLAPASGGGGLSLNWTQTWDQYWTYFTYISSTESWMSAAADTQLVGSYSSVWTPQVNAKTDVVSFTGGGNANLAPQKAPGWFKAYVEDEYAVDHQFAQTFAARMEATLSNLDIPHVNTFALGNILFPSRQDVLSLTQAVVPADLLLTGQVASRLQVEPGNVSLKPGAQVQFSALLDGQPTTEVSWEIVPSNIGSFKNGLYTAPTQLGEPEVLVVVAILNADLNVTARAQILVYDPPSPTGLVITPSNFLVTQGNPMDLFVRDEQGSLIDADCTIAPATGSLERGWTTGMWVYLPPETITESSQVTVTAASNNGQSTGTATIQLATIEPVTLAPATATLSPNQSVLLTATAATCDTFTYAVFPTGAGTVSQPRKGSPTATYTAPASPGPNTRVMIAAYCIQNGTAGIALAEITLSAA